MLKDFLTFYFCFSIFRFFETEPSVKKVFPKIVKINDSNELELDMDMEVLSRHASNVMHSLGAAVESLDHSEFFNGIVENIGRSHGQRKIKPKMLEVQLFVLHNYLYPHASDVMIFVIIKTNTIYLINSNRVFIFIMTKKL